MCSATWAPGTEEKGLTALRKELGGQEHCWLLLIGDSCQPQAVSTRHAWDTEALCLSFLEDSRAQRPVLTPVLFKPQSAWRR